MRRRSPAGSVVLAAVMLLFSACRTAKRKPEPEVVETRPLLTSKLELPRRGMPVSDFERLAHWEVRSDSGTVKLSKNLSKSIWGRNSAEISFVPASPGPHRITLTPAEPWQIQSPFDTVLIWVYDDGEPGLRKDRILSVNYRDATGALSVWEIPYKPKSGWQMLHVRLPEQPVTPAQIESLQWILPEKAQGRQTLSLDAMSIYQEVLSSIPQNVHYVRPFDYAPIYAPLRKNSVILDFPTRSAAFRPDTRPEKSIQKLSRLEGQKFLFRFESAGTQLGYRVGTESGMPSVEVVFNGKVYPGLWRRAEVMLDNGTPEFRFARMAEDKLLLQYTDGVQFEFSLHGKTLQIEMNSLLENVKSFRLGAATSAQSELPQVLQVPMMRLREDIRWPVLSVKDGDQHFLFSIFPDWWYSMASQFKLSEGEDGISGIGLGSMVYEQRWRGNRNTFRERIYFTVSKRLQDVLPSPASPVAMYRPQMSKVEWKPDHELPSMNLMSVKPIELIWEDRILARSMSGDWLEHPVDGFVIKSGLFDEIPIERLLEYKKSHPGDLLVVPAVAQYPPWKFLDRDIRSVGAASYTQTLSEAGALLQQAAAEWGGGLLSRGGAEWFWVGLVSGFIPEFPLGFTELHPIIPHFTWQNVHPFTQILGLGHLDDFRLPTDSVRDEELLLNRLLAMQVAYGAFGRVPQLKNAFLKTKAERFRKTLQAHFVGARVDRIAYWSGERFMDAGEALHSGVLRKSKLYIRLNNETEIWVNGDFSEEWKLRVDGRQIVLPSFGFVVRGNDLFVMNLPAGPDRNGLSLMESPDVTWVSSPDEKVDELNMRLRGSLQVLQHKNGVVQLDIADWHGEAAISADLLHLEKANSVRAVDERGNPVREVHFHRVGEEWLLQSDSPLRRVWISEEITGRDRKFSP